MDLIVMMNILSIGSMLIQPDVDEQLSYSVLATETTPESSK